MAASQVERMVQQLRETVAPRHGGEQTDGQLLEGFVTRRDQEAFGALVRRHGPMVLGVCRRLLQRHQDAEDAFQATFLVLVRKAASIVPREMLPNWLYGVSYNTALKARAAAARRQAKEKQVTAMPEPETAKHDLWDEVSPLLDQELSRLPDIYRLPIISCDLEGRTRAEAARQLGWSEGTLSGRLFRAREMLAQRLTRRGLVLSAAALPAALSGGAASAAVPMALTAATISAGNGLAAGFGVAAGAMSAEVAALTDGVLRTMLVAKLKVCTAILAVIGLVGIGGAGLAYRLQGSATAPAAGVAVLPAVRPVPREPPELVEPAEELPPLPELAPPPDGPSGKVAVGGPAPAFKVIDPTGKTIDLAELTAKGPVLVRLTCAANNCGCDSELAFFQAIHDAYKEQGLTCLFIFRSPDAVVAKYAQNKKLDMLYAVDPKGASWSTFQTQTMPTNFLIEKGGKIAASTVGCDPSGLLANKVSEKAALLFGIESVNVKNQVEQKKAKR